MVTQGRLPYADSVRFYWSDQGIRSDIFLFWIFEQTENSSAATITEQLRNREPVLGELRRRLVRSPHSWNRPFWVRHDGPLLDWVEIDDRPLTWEQCHAAINEHIGGPQVDPQVQPWLLRIHSAVDGVPDVPGRATVAVLQCSHTLLAGSGFAAVSEGFFGTRAEPIAIPGLVPARDREPHTLPEWLNAAAAPAEMLGYLARTQLRRSTVREAAVAQRAAKAAAGESPLLCPAASNVRDLRYVRLPLADVRGHGHTVTAVATTIISRALDRYSAQSGTPTDRLTADMPVFLAGAQHLGVNNLGAATIDLHCDIADLSARTAAIGADLAAAQASLRSGSVEQFLDLQSGLPYALFRFVSNRAGTANFAHRSTEISSVNLGDLELKCAGGALVAAGFFQGGGRSLTHSLLTCGDSIVITATIDPAVITDADAYEAALAAAATEVHSFLSSGYR